MTARSAADIRADLADCDRDGLPWPSAARRLLADVPDLLESRDGWRRIAEYGLHLAMYGERAPGGEETWSQFARLMRERAESDAALSATCIHGQTRHHTVGVEGALGTGVIGTGVCMGPAPEQSR